MIVYAGKQYWNDFNNWDEALFQDANRPRDNDKFKLRPWLQSDKWDFRWTNKNINTKAAQLIAESTRTTAAMTAYLLSPLSEKYKEWDPWCIINKDWNIEIVEDGTYIIQAFTQYLFWSTPADWYQYIENVALLKRKNGSWVIQTKSQWRVCANWWDHSDQLVAWQAWWFPKWTILNVWSNHSYWSSITLYQVMNIQRLV